MIGRLLDAVFYNPYRAVNKKKGEASVSSSTILTKNFKLDFRAVNQFNTRVVIGESNILGCQIILESDEGRVEIGDNCFINAGTRLISRASIRLGDYVTVAWGVTIYDHDSHSLNHECRRRDILQQLKDYPSGNAIVNKDWGTVMASPIIIEDDVWVGMNATILKGVRIGRGAVVGAHAVVTKDVEPWTVVAGNPAKVVKIIPR